MPTPLRCDRILMLSILTLVFFGLVMVFSATAANGGGFGGIAKQSLAALIGLCAMRVLIFCDYDLLRSQRVLYGSLGVVILLLLATLWVGGGPDGTRRYLKLSYVSFQTSEFAKLAVVLALAYWADQWGDRLGRARTVLGSALLLGVVGGLVLAGKDLGSVVVIVLVGGAVVFAAGLNSNYFAGGLAIGVPLFLLAARMEYYRWLRLISFLDPEADRLRTGYQVIQSKLAVGSGEIFGQGLMIGRQKMRYLPVADSDFIFAVVGEELGFVGCLFAVALFGVVLWRGLAAAMSAPDDFGRYLAVGLTAAIVCQAMINMGVVLQMLPTKGLTLPFISYGGSSLIAMMMAAGVLLNVSRRAA